MRPHWFGLLALLGASSANASDARADAEHYENIRVDAGIIGSVAAVSDRNGTGMAVEIKGMAHDNIAIGGRVELAVLFGGVIGQDEAPLDIGVGASGIVKGEYLLGTGPIRPFVGFGIGGYTISSQTIDAGPNQDGIATTTGRYFGIAPQLGVDLGRVRLVATYNAILGAYLELHQTIGNVEQTSRQSQNFLSLELSFQFAGGRKPAPGPTPGSSLANTPRAVLK